MSPSPAGLVYGTIAIGALLTAESAQSETYAKSVVAVVITLLLYWLAYSYAEFTGQRLEKGEPFEFGELATAAVKELSVLIGASIPLLVLVIFWAAGARLATAVSAAIWTSAAMIVIIEFVVGLRASLTGRQLIMQTGFGAFLGLLVLTLRIVLH
jgi:hypothetical protein